MTKTIYAVQIEHALFVNKTMWGLIKACKSWFAPRYLLNTLNKMSFQIITIGKTKLSKDAKWRIVRDTSTCPDCGEYVRHRFSRCCGDAVVVYDCPKCEFYDEMDIS